MPCMVSRPTMFLHSVLILHFLLASIIQPPNNSSLFFTTAHVCILGTASSMTGSLFPMASTTTCFEFRPPKQLFSTFFTQLHYIADFNALIPIVCFIIINKILFNLSCVWILFKNATSHSCFGFKINKFIADFI